MDSALDTGQPLKRTLVLFEVQHALPTAIVTKLNKNLATH